MDAKIINEIHGIMTELENDVPGITEGIAGGLGLGTGAGISYAMLYGLGTVGVSASGITSGLAAAGALIGGGMAAGISVIAAPIFVLGGAGYFLAKKRRKAKTLAALNLALEKLFAIQERLVANAEHFKDELAHLKSIVDQLKERIKKL